MSNKNSDLWDRVKQGDVESIEALFNLQLASRNMTVSVSQSDETLEVTVSCFSETSISELKSYFDRSLLKLPSAIKQLKISTIDSVTNVTSNELTILRSDVESLLSGKSEKTQRTTATSIIGNVILVWLAIMLFALVVGVIEKINPSEVSEDISPGESSESIITGESSEDISPSESSQDISPSESNESSDEETGTLWRCYKSVSGQYETLEYPYPRSKPPGDCQKVR